MGAERSASIPTVEYLSDVLSHNPAACRIVSMYRRIQDETWANERAKKSVLTGIHMSLAQLARDI